jgi:hypothetical protein
MGNQAPFRPRWRLAILAISGMLVSVSCGNGGAAESTSTTLPATTSTTAPADATTTTVPADTTTTTVPADTTTTTTPPDTTTTLPGESIDLFWQEGDMLGVVGVAHDDVLNVRQGPGVSFDVVATLQPLADQVVATGRSRMLVQSIWTEIEVGATTGWVNVAYLAYLGDTSDDTADTVATIGETPAAETMVDLGSIVAEAHASTDPASEIVLSVAPEVGDLGEITYDVIGLGDDALFGVRLHVFGAPDAGGEGFTLHSVELTLLCGRGVSDDGFCV